MYCTPSLTDINNNNNIPKFKTNKTAVAELSQLVE